MRIGVTGDWHLGAPLPGRTEGGRSVRQMDVERAVATCVRKMIEQRVDLVLLTGDLMDSVTPNTHAKVALIDAVRKMTDSGAWVVAIGGNHDTPRTVGVRSPLDVLRGIKRCVVAHNAGPVRVRLQNGETAGVFCAPFQALSGAQRITPEPLRDADVNLLLIHAAVRSSARPGALPHMYAGPTSYDVARAEGFDVVACGDFHETRVLATGAYTAETNPRWDTLPSAEPDPHGPLAFYPGSLERVSSNIWQEEAPKGWVLVDTDERTLDFVEVPTRGGFSALCNRESMREAGYGVPEVAVNDSLRDLLKREGTADRCVRLVVEDFPPSERHGIDWRLVRQLQQRCVLFNLDIRYAQAEAREVATQGQSIEQAAEAFFAEDEPAVRDAALAYLNPKE